MEVNRIRAQDPNFRGAITVEQSVDEQLALLAKVTLAESGSLLLSSEADNGFAT